MIHTLHTHNTSIYSASLLFYNDKTMKCAKSHLRELLYAQCHRVGLFARTRFDGRAVFALEEAFINRKKTDKWAEGDTVARGPGRNQPTSNRESSLGRGIRADQFGGHTFLFKVHREECYFLVLPPLLLYIFDTCSKKRK